MYLKEVKKEHLGSYKSVGLTFNSLKRLWRTFTGTQKDKVIWNSQHGFTKGRSCFTHLVFLYDETIGSEDNGRTMDIDFGKTFDTVSYSILTIRTIRWAEIWLDVWVQRLVKSHPNSSWQPSHGTAVPFWARQECLMSLSVT